MSLHETYINQKTMAEASLADQCTSACSFRFYDIPRFESELLTAYSNRRYVKWLSETDVTLWALAPQSVQRRGYGLNARARFQAGAYSSSLSTTTRLALGFTPDEVDHSSPSSAEDENVESIPPLPLRHYNVVLKHRDNFYLLRTHVRGALVDM
jgi:hypothetical protein